MRRLALCALLLAVTARSTSAGPKDPKTAKILSGSAAAVSGAVVLTGFVASKDGEPFNLPILYTGLGLLAVAPSLGEFYAGQYLTIGMGVRIAGTGLAVYTLERYTQPSKCISDPPSEPNRCKSLTEGAYPLLGIAAITFIGGVWYDVLDASDAADRYNKKHGFTTVVPAVVPGPQGPAPGVLIGGTF
jgi:hypothetical protein